VVGEAVDGYQAAALCRRLRPDVVLVDVRMPGLDGLAAAGAIRRACPGTRIIMLATGEDSDDLSRARTLGVAGCVPKSASERELVATVRQVLGGACPAEPTLAGRPLEPPAGPAGGRAAPSSERLTPREREVLRLVARGRTNREIGRDLTLSVSTVKTHIEHIIGKLGASDRTHAAVRAAELGLLA
jgi:DNA-binding NarL/FixJ family response regulator